MWLLEGRQSYWEGNKRKGWLSVREIERDYKNGFRVVVLSYVRDTRNFNPYQPPFLSGGNRQRSCFRQISTLMVFCGQRTEMRLESCPVLIYPLIFLPPLCLSLCLLKCYVSKQMQELLHLYKLKWENTNCFLSLGHIYHFRSSKGKKYVLLLFCVFTSSKGKDMRHHLKEDRWDVTLQNNQAISKGEIWHPSEEAALHGFYVQSYYFINYVQRVAIDEGRSTNKSAI